MLSRYEMRTKDERINATHEVMQQIALAGLYKAGFFDKRRFDANCIALPRPCIDERKMSIINIFTITPSGRGTNTVIMITDKPLLNEQQIYPVAAD